jgi:isopenicillin-N N-acyltransferase-like protein
MSIPIISLTGSPYEIGYRHGKIAKEAIKHNIQFYLDLWNYFSGVDKSQVLENAREFIPYIERIDSELIEELKGVAEGCGVEFEEIVALNARWELNHSYFSPTVPDKALDGCTAFAISTEATKNKHTFIGQNWDYKTGVKESCIILIIKQQSKPDIIINTEAGIIGHKGFNSAGIGIGLNFIRCNRDVFHEGLPMLIKVRSILNAETLSECLKIIMTFEGPNSGNIVIAHRDGEAIDIECLPDDSFFLYPKGGILTHANHFLSLSFQGKDTGRALLPDTVIRNNRAFGLFQNKRGNLGFDTIKQVLRDHFDYPNSICRHRNERLELYESWETITSMIIDLTEGKMLYTSGPPCSNSYEAVAIGDLT